MIDSSSPPDRLPRQSLASEPVHLRLAGICRKAIVGGDFAPGDRFPSERELAERYEVSRATANKVISTLIAEGLLDLEKGIGTRVRKGKTLFASLGGMESFTGHAESQGMTPSTDVLTFRQIVPPEIPAPVRAGLRLEPGSDESVVFIERLRRADNVPMILEARWVRESLAPGLTANDVSTSFYRMLEDRFGLAMTGESHTISAVLLAPEEVAHFALESPPPALRVEGTGFIRGDVPLWYQRLLYRGDRYELHNETRGPATSGIELRLNGDAPPSAS